MTQKWIAGSVIFVAALFVGCDKPPAPDTRAADVKAIRELEEGWAEVAATKDAAKFVTYYSADALVLMSGAPAMRGIDAITTGLKGAMADPNFSIAFRTTKVTVAKSGELAYTEGTYEQTVTDPATKKKAGEKANYVTCWVKQADNSWKAATDVTMMEQVPAAPAAPAAKKKM